MTVINRISSTYGSGGGGYYGYGNERKQKSNHVSIWGEPSYYESNYSLNNFIGANNGIEGVNYAQPGASYVPIDQVMTAPFGANADLLGTSNQNPFASGNYNAASIISNLMSRFVNKRNFLSLTGNHNHLAPNFGNHSNNIFKNHVSSHNPNNLRFSSTSIKAGGFGSKTLSSRMTSIHTPSVDFNTREINAGNKSISQTKISGDINSYRQTNQHIQTPNANLNRTLQVINTPTEKITRTVTKGTIRV